MRLRPSRSPVDVVDNSSLLDSYRENERDLIRFLMRRIRCAFTARDLAQEVYIKLDAADGAQPIENPRAYLFRVAANLAIDHQRAEGRRANLLDEAQDYLTGIAASHSPERILIAQEEVARVSAAIETLSPAARRVFAMNRFDSKTQREIADELGISTVAVEKHIRKALAVLSKARRGE